jgi:hypothetical protein
MDRPLIVVIAALAILALSCAPEPAVSEAVPLHWISADMGPGIGVVERATVMVDVLVDSKPAWLQLDTGATYTTLTPSVLDALGVRYRKGVKAEGWGLPGAAGGHHGQSEWSFCRRSNTPERRGHAMGTDQTWFAWAEGGCIEAC